jgi:hypothetical protein
MSNAAIAHTNLADLGSVTASSSVALMPPSRLLDPHVARKWRSASATGQNLTFDLGSLKLFDTVAIVGTNLTAGGTTQLRVSGTDATALGSLLYDSGAATGRVDPSYGYLIFLMPSSVSGRYVRVDLSDAALSYVEAGRAFIGRRTQLSSNFTPGWTRGWVDRSRRTESRGGQIYVDRNTTYRTLELSFEMLTLTERDGILEDIDRLSGERDDILMLTNPASTNLGRDSVWGLIDGNQPVVQPYVVDRFNKSYRIRERL